MRAVVAVALLSTLTLAGCSNGQDDSSPTPSSGSSSSGSASASATAAACQDDTFAPAAKVHVGGTTTEILYVARVAVAPSGKISGTGLDRDTLVHPGIRLTEPAGTPLPADVRHQVAAVLDGYPTTPLKQGRATPWEVSNRGRTNRSYLVFNPGKVTSGTWRATACGAPVNDGSQVVTLRGRWTSAKVQQQLYVTGCKLRYGTAIEREGARQACL